MANDLDLHSGSAIDVGRNPKRRVNQDRLGVFEPLAEDCQEYLYLVCDGMGGHQAGEVASSIAIQEIPQAYYRARKRASIKKALRNAVREAHKAIKEHASSRHELRTMGTTAVVSVIFKDRYYVANVGDSRAYLIRERSIQQLTKDHSQEAAIAIRRDRNKLPIVVSRRRHILTRSLNAVRDSVEVDIFEGDFQTGDVLVLCSDGLWNAIPEALITRTVLRLPSQKAADILVKMVNRAGGPDNISVIVVRRGVYQTRKEEDTGEFALATS